MNSKRSTHSLDCECRKSPDGACDCPRGRDRRSLAKAKNALKRRRGVVDIGLDGGDWLGGLLTGKNRKHFTKRKDG